MPKLPNLLGLTDGNQSFCHSAKSTVATRGLEDLQKYGSEGLLKSKRIPQDTGNKLVLYIFPVVRFPDHSTQPRCYHKQYLWSQGTGTV